MKFPHGGEFSLTSKIFREINYYNIYWLISQKLCKNQFHVNYDYALLSCTYYTLFSFTFFQELDQMSRKYRVAEQHIKTLKTECKRRKQTIESQQVSHFLMNNGD